MKLAGVIPKNQFQTMVEDMKKMKACIDNGMPIAIFPAGLMSADGISTPIPASTGKTLKWFNQDVYVAKSSGSYLTCPKWSSKMRKGRIDIDVYKLFDKNELATLSEKEVQSKIETALYYNAYENQLKNMVKYKGGSNAEGFENVLYKCPSCKSEFSIKCVTGVTLKCDNCGYESSKWLGKCPGCNEWNSFYEEKIVKDKSGAFPSDKKTKSSKPTTLNSIEGKEARPYQFLGDVVRSL